MGGRELPWVGGACPVGRSLGGASDAISRRAKLGTRWAELEARSAGPVKVEPGQRRRIGVG